MPAEEDVRYNLSLSRLNSDNSLCFLLCLPLPCSLPVHPCSPSQVSFVFEPGLQEAVEHLQHECSVKDKEFGFALDPRKQIRGHDVQGDPVEWIPCPEREHMICVQECQKCFLVTIEDALAELISNL